MVNDNYDGITLDNCEDIIIENNEVENNEDYGVYINDCDSITLTDNTVFNNTNDGIRLELTTLSLIEYNTLTYNLYGIHLLANSDYNTVSKNTANNKNAKTKDNMIPAIKKEININISLFKILFPISNLPAQLLQMGIEK